MDQDLQNKSLPSPLPENIIKAIMEEHPQLGSFLVSTIDFTIRASENHYADVTRSVMPLLKEGTRNFVNKIFALAEGPATDLKPAKRVTFDLLPAQETLKNKNCEVIFNKVNEQSHTMEDMRSFAGKFGKVLSIRRLNRGKYLIIMADPESSQLLVADTEPVLGDSKIKKFFNVIAQSEEFKNINIEKLLQEQQSLLNKLSVLQNSETLSGLRLVTHKIRNYIMAFKFGNCNNKEARERGFKKIRPVDVEPEKSIYFNMFSE